MTLQRLIVLALLAVSLCGCETTAEKSARLERAAKQSEGKQVSVEEKGLKITHASTSIKVLAATVVHDSERAAAVVTLENRSSQTERDVPIAIDVKDAHGRTLFQNNGVGLEGALVAVPSIAAHTRTFWVDDQLPSGGDPTLVTARVGQAPPVSGPLPSVSVGQARLSEDPAEGTIATGRVTNRSHVVQSGLVVFALARRGGKILAAGRAVVQQLSAGASAPFQIAFVGEAQGTQLQLSAPPASFK